MKRASRLMIGPRFFSAPAFIGLLFASCLSSAVQAQVTPAYRGGPYIYVPLGQPRASVGAPIAEGWEKLGDGIVGNEPAGRSAFPTVDRRQPGPEARRTDRDAKGQPRNLDVRFTAHGWVVVWDRLVPLTDLTRDGSLYAVHRQENGRVRITLDGRELFRDVLFAAKYEQARTLLEGR